MNYETISNNHNIKRISNYSIQSFERDILSDQINSKLIALFEAEILEIFPNILIISKNEFMNLIESRIKASIMEQYPNDNIEKIFKNNKFNNIFNNNMQILQEKYILYMKELTESWENYKIRLSIKKVKKEELFFTDFTKHCIKTGEYALHKCSKDKYGEFLSVLHKSSVDGTLSVRYLICKKCKKSYFTSLFLNYCKECDATYYSNKLINRDKSELQLATFNPPHCKSLFNKKIICPKCTTNNLYLNLNTNKVCCLNKKCNFICNSENSSWNCDICNNYFKTNIKIYNPLEIQNVKDAIKLALLIKKKAHPIRMICCNEINVYNCIFYHNKKCNGILYLGELDKNSIIICQKCKAINYFNNFIWTCPSCGKRFKENPDNCKKIKKKIENKVLENNIKINEVRKETLIFNKRNESSTTKHAETIEEKGNLKNYMFHKLRNFEVGRNQDKNNSNNLIEQRTSITTANSKKRYILSKYLEMQITQNNSKSKKDENVNSSKNLNEKENEYDEKIKTVHNYYYSNEKKKNRIYYKNKFLKKNVLNEDVKNNEEEKDKNRVLKNIRRESNIKGIKENNSQNEIKNKYINNNNTQPNTYNRDKNININYRKPISSDHKNFYFNKVNKRNSSKPTVNEKTREKGTKLDNLKFNDSLEDINNSKENNIFFSKDNSKNNIKKYISTEIIEEKTPNYNNLVLYKSHNLFNVRQKYISNRNNKKNEQTSNNSNNNNNSNLKNEKNINIIKYHENSANLDRNANYKNRLMYKRMLNELNSSSKEKDNNNNNNNNKINEITQRNLIKDLEKEQKSERIKYKYKLKEYNENKVGKYENDEPLIIDSNNEKSKESTTEGNKNSKKSDISIETTPKQQLKQYDTKISNDIDISKDYINKDENYNHIETNDTKYTNLDDIDLLEREKELQEKEELLKEILANLEKEEELRKRPEDIMEISNVLKDSNFSIPVLSNSIKENDKLYENIQNQIKTILSKGKLPLFNIKNYIIRKQIGDGSYGFIYQVVQKDTRKEYAIKKIIASDLPTLRDFQNEFEIVHQNPHKYILDLYGICINIIDADNFILYVLMDLADCDWEMEINEYLINNKFYSEKQLILILKQLTSALTFLERDKKIAHRDIKPENVLVFRSNSNDKEDIYKIADFGEAKEAKVSKQLNTLRGTELYMSPLLYSGLQQKLDDVKHDPYKSDVFSLGYCLIYAAAMNFNVIYDIRNLENKYIIKKVLKKYFNRRYSDKFIELILKMISFNEAERVDFIQLEKILENEF